MLVQQQFSNQQPWKMNSTLLKLSSCFLKCLGQESFLTQAWINGNTDLLMGWFLVPWITWNNSLVSELVSVELLMEGALTRVREGIRRSPCRAMCLCHLEYAGLAVLLSLSPPHPHLSEFLTLLAIAAHGSGKQLRLLSSTLVTTISLPCLQLMLPLGLSYAPCPTF